MQETRPSFFVARPGCGVRFAEASGDRPEMTQNAANDTRTRRRCRLIRIIHREAVIPSTGIGRSFSSTYEKLIF